MLAYNSIIGMKERVQRNEKIMKPVLELLSKSTAARKREREGGQGWKKRAPVYSIIMCI